MRLIAWTGGNFRKTTGAERLHSRRLRCHPLSAQCLHRPASSMVEHAYTFSGEGIGGRGLNHCCGKAHGHGRVEGIATTEEHAHASHRCEVMAASHHAMCTPHYWSTGRAAYHFCMFLIVLSCHRDSPFYVSPSLPRSAVV